MDNRDLEKMLLLQTASDINTFEDLVSFFILHQEHLNDYTLINATDNSSSIDIYSVFSNEKSAENHLSTPFVDGRINIINKRILRKVLRNKQAQTGLEMCVSFDTQTVSYFNRYYRKQLTSLPKDIDKAINLLYEHNVGVDYIPYTMENLMFSSENIDNVLDSICTFELLYHKNEKNKKKCMKEAKKITKWYKKMRSNNSSEVNRLFYHVYATILKMCYIQLKFPHRSVEKKMELLCEFMHNELCTMLQPELILSKQYFKYGQDYRFFGKVQKGRDDIVKTIKNMSWDLFHMRMLEAGCAYKKSKKSDVFVPCFFTYDKRLQEAKGCYELKSIAINHKTHQRFPFYAQIDEIIEYIEKYSTAEKLLERNAKRGTVNIDKLIEELEKDISNV